eukprot:365250-Chlamydomonas_euryale.AAC.10
MPPLLFPSPMRPTLPPSDVHPAPGKKGCSSPWPLPPGCPLAQEAERTHAAADARAEISALTAALTAARVQSAAELERQAKALGDAAASELKVALFGEGGGCLPAIQKYWALLWRQSSRWLCVGRCV